MNSKNKYKVPDVMDKIFTDVMSGLYFPISGENFSKRIILAKCNLTCDLLLNTDLTLEKIVLYLDFKNLNVLTKTFIKYIGICPLEFRSRFKIKEGV